MKLTKKALTLPTGEDYSLIPFILHSKRIKRNIFSTAWGSVFLLVSSIDDLNSFIFFRATRTGRELNHEYDGGKVIAFTNFELSFKT